MANAVQDIKIKVKVDGAGQAYVQIDKLGGGFMKATTAAKHLQDAIKKQNPVLKGSVADYQRQIKALKSVRDNTAKTAAEYKNQTISIEKLQAKQRELTVSTNAVNKVNADQVSNAGLAGATLTELGRTISDLPYGIQGVANNLSQLSTLFVTLVSKSDGAKNALKQLGAQLSGPLGLILLFQTVISAIDFFAKKSREAKAEVDDFSNSFGQSAANLMSYQKLLNSTSISEEKKSHILKQVNEEFKGLNIELEENNQLTKESNALIDQNVSKLKKQAEARALFERLVELNTEKLKIEFELRKSLGDEYDAFVNSVGNSVRAMNGAAGSLLSFLGVDKIEGYLENLGKTDDEIADIVKRISALDLNIFDDSDGKKGMKAYLDDFNKYITTENDKLKVALNQSEVQRLEEIRIQRSNAIRIEIDERKAKEKKRYEDGLITYEEFLSRRAQLNDLYNRKIAQLNTDTDRQILETKLKQIQDGLKLAATLFDDLLESEITREERRTTLANNSLKQRLKNEKLSAKERENINKQIEANEESLAKKRDKLAEKQFKINKAVSISTALVNTYLAATDVLAREKMGALGKILAMTAIIGAGLAQVAAIARTQFVPSAVSGSGGGGGGGASIQAPDFNVVGASQTSQLAEAVAGQQAKPVKSFVVGKDISTQQELDRNITNTASFG
jgi:hypothetical protein